MDNKKALGLRIKELRKNRRISQEELAELTGLEPPSICNIENGKNYPALHNLEKIIKVLGVSFTDIFSFEHHQHERDLRGRINRILDSNPEKIKDFYKIIKALSD